MDAPWGVKQIWRVWARRRIRLRLVRHRTIPSGYLILIQLRWGWMLWYRLGRGFICMPFPDRSAHRNSRESVPGWGPSIAKTPFWPDRVWFSDLIPLLEGSPWGFPSAGISSHWQQAWSFTPARSCGSCGCGSWGGTTDSLWSLNWGCWDHPAI